MESLLKSFHLSPTHVSTVLQLTGGIIAGSAPLSVVKPTFVPNDLDIWVVDTPEHKAVYDVLLTNAGYVHDKDAFNFTQSEHHELYETNTHIKTIKQYKHADGKKVQVIYLSCSPIKNLEWFDLNICRIYYDGSELHSDYMDDILKGVLYYTGVGKLEDNKKSLGRFEKYTERGFKTLKRQRVD